MRCLAALGFVVWTLIAGEMISTEALSKSVPLTGEYPDLEGIMYRDTETGYRRVSEPIRTRFDKKKIVLIYTQGGNSDHAPCVFPFQYKGKTYTKCTTVDASSGNPWCSTTNNYDIDELWGYCVFDRPEDKCKDKRKDCGKWARQALCQISPVFMNKVCPRSCGQCTWGGTGKNKPCVFPFIYQNNVFFKCPVAKLEQYKGQIWCGTTDNVDKDDKWGFCYPQLFESILEANRPFLRYGECDDKSDNCREWVEQGLCESHHTYMDKMCPWGCKRCAPRMLLRSTKCKDHHDKCAYWASRNECIDNPLFMYGMCRFSCHLCAKDTEGEAIKDAYHDCSKWAADGQCKTNGVFMVQNCRTSCKAGEYINGVKCFDQMTFCKKWARKGYCQKNPTLMQKQCTYSCGLCSGQGTIRTRDKVLPSKQPRSHNQYEAKQASKKHRH
ncbi:uncharacterized protein LOC5504462 [Nematostella vectensis]|nr:uncharacterized protein LOC5504462 [Nematostella vectensis]XP_048585868.1 uncharacterized protein LOC5504462 [Nematostella vectensis]XP_048585869.1 uncharacterized protein LOC5504462 [Nematostella vectensis]